MNRKLLIAVVAFVLLALGIVVYERTATPTVAIVTYGAMPILDDSIAGIKQSLAEHGYGPGKVRITESSANAQPALLPALVSEILASKPTVVVPVSTPVAQLIVNKAPSMQSIVFSTVTHPEDLWKADQPPNVTGVSDVPNYAANLALIREIAPSARVIGTVYNPGEANSRYGMEIFSKLVKDAGLELKSVTVGSTNEVPDAARSLAAAIDVFYIGSDNTSASAAPAIFSAARARHLVVVASDSGTVESGATAAVSVDYKDVGRKAGDIVAEILKTGTPAGKIPNVLYNGNTLIVNVKSALESGITIPPAVIARAAKVLK